MAGWNTVKTVVDINVRFSPDDIGVGCMPDAEVRQCLASSTALNSARHTRFLESPLALLLTLLC